MINIIKNVNGSSRWPKPSTGESSWLEYWKNNRKKAGTIKCGYCGATFDLVGAHVRKLNGGQELYITPLCKGCNNQGGELDVDTELVRVPNGL